MADAAEKKPFDFAKFKKDLFRDIKTSQIWKSIFRHGYDDNPRNRAMMVLSNVFLHIYPTKVHPAAIRFRYTWRLGSMSFYLFLLLAITGVFLMFYYRPTVEHAYWDMKDLRFAVPFGVVLRNIHRWAAHTMVLFVMLHMAAVFYRGAYKAPREFNWVIGVILLLITFLLSFTGYLLPWDQLALWAITVGANMAAATPVLGAEGPFAIVTADNDAKFILLGSKLVGQAALLRFYVLHCVLLPIAFIVLVSVHLWRVRKDEFSAVPLPPKEERANISVEDWNKQNPDEAQKKVFSWPNLIGKEFLTFFILSVLLLLWALVQNAPLETLADAATTPNPSKAPWYFVGLQELLVYFDPWMAGVILPKLIIVGLMAIPYIDNNPKGVGYYNVKDRPLAFSMFTFGLVFWFVLIFIGLFMRGPGWELYMPGEPWDYHRPPSSVDGLWDFSNFWGFIFMGIYGSLGVLPWFIWNDWAKKLGIVKYSVLMVLVLSMFFVPVKIILRLAFDVKYILSFPAFNLNI